jgi:hypothetical protein
MEINKIPEIEGADELTHYTCTSTPLSKTPGSNPEHISRGVLDKIHLERYGVKVSDDPAVAIIQRERVIRDSKRQT